MQYTDDPPSDWDAYCREQERFAALLPHCEECGCRIEDDFTYDFDGYYICEECLIRNHRKHTTDLVVE